jgi:ABC-type sulfate transport system permease subunit
LATRPTRNSIKLTLITAAEVVPLNTVFGITAAGVSPSSNFAARASSSR